MNGNRKAKQSHSLKQSLNTQLPSKATKSVTVISHNRCSADANVPQNGRNRSPIDTNLMIPKCHSDKYAKPELNSAKVLTKRLDTLKNAADHKLTDFNQMTPRSKFIATEKALKKLNFPPDKPVYKHLVPVNVNDSILDVKPLSMRKHSKSKTTYVQTAKDPVPELSRYLKPMPRLQHQLTLDDVEDDDECISRHKKSMDSLANTQFIRMREFYEQYLCPISAGMHNECD